MGNIITIDENIDVNKLGTIKGKTLVFQGGKITGVGELKGCYISASPYEQIFEQTVVVNPLGCIQGYFSCCWYGASPKLADNSVPINLSLQVMSRNMVQVRKVFLPAGVYKTENGIDWELIRGDKYAVVTGTFYGEDWRDNGTTIKYSGKNGYAINIQLGKSTKLTGIKFEGVFKSPDPKNQRIYCNLTREEFQDPLCDKYLSGIAIDYKKPLDGKTYNGSTGVKIIDCFSGGFSNCFAFSINGVTKNCDDILVENPQIGDGVFGFVGGNDQLKANIINIVSWGKLYRMIASEIYGNQRASVWNFDRGNIAGDNISLVENWSASWGYGVTMSNIEVERIAYIGSLQSATSLGWRNMRFKFISPNDIGYKTLLDVKQLNTIQFTDCTFRYFEEEKFPMVFAGYPIFNNCMFSGKVISPNFSVEWNPIFINSRSNTSLITTKDYTGKALQTSNIVTVQDTKASFPSSFASSYIVGDWYEINTKQKSGRQGIGRVISSVDNLVTLDISGSIDLESGEYTIRPIK